MTQIDQLQCLPSGAAGLDVRKMQVTAMVRHYGVPESRIQTREFSALPQGLRALCDWLCTEGVTDVAMEATGIYWEKPHNMLRETGLEVSVVNAQQIKQIRGIRRMCPTACGNRVSPSLVWPVRVWFRRRTFAIGVT